MLMYAENFDTSLENNQNGFDKFPRPAADLGMNACRLRVRSKIAYVCDILPSLDSASFGM
jgi:hypothetical protein